MDLRALSLTKRFFRKFPSVERLHFAELFRIEFRCDARAAQALIDDLVDGGYLSELESDGRRMVGPGPNLDSGVLALVGVKLPPM